MPPNSAVIIGAGIGGLATAGLLAKHCVQVTVVEKNDEVGGRVGSLTLDGFRWDVGPSWYLMPEVFDRFFALMGTSTEAELNLVTLDPGYRMFFEGENPMDISHGATKIEELFESVEPGAGTQIRNYLHSSAEMYQLALQQYLYNNFTSPRLLFSRTTLSKLPLLGTSLRRFVNHKFQDHRLRKILQYPAVFLSSQPKHIPAFYHLMSHADLTQGVRYPLGGFQEVVSALYRLAVAEGVQFRLGQEVTEIYVDDAGVQGVRMVNRQGIPSGQLANVVISNADIQHTEMKLLPPKFRSYDQSYFAQRDPGISAVLVLLGVEGKLPTLAHHNLLMSRDWDADFAAVFDNPGSMQASRSIYVSKPSASDQTVAPEGCENLFVFIPVASNTSIGHGNAYRQEESPIVRTIASAAVRQIAEWANIPNLVDRVIIRRTIGPQDFEERYYSWQGGALGPSHTLTQSAFFRGKNISRRVIGLLYVGGTIAPGVGVPMCLISAENILTRLGIKP